MSDTDIRTAVLRALAHIAPEIEPGSLRGDVPLREQVDLDSMDFLNFVLALHADLGIDVPETDYTELATLDGCVTYLAKQTALLHSVPRSSNSG